MTARIIDGNALSARVRDEIAQRAAALTARGVQPCLAVILVGGDAASAVYVRNKVAGCEKAGIRSLRFDYPANATQEEVMAKLADLGRLSQGLEAFIPCTPHGVMKMLESAEVPVQGAEAVIIGRSNIVGKPMAMLLTNAGATVTVCHSKTRDLASHTRRADILVAAIGKPRFVTADMVKPGATVIDVGINRLQDGPDAGKLCGDVDFEAVKAVAAAITPVPGGVGPMTITMLLENTVISAARVARAARK